MRSLAEVAFRARQEAANLLLLLAPPKFHGEISLPVALPDPHAVADALRGSGYAQQLESIAQSVLAHRFPLLGIEIETGPAIRWRRDYVHGIESGTAYFRRIPYLNFAAVGDHKFIWELNRHQHLVLLGQAFLLTGQTEFTREIFAQLESWLDQNPFQRGINWASALEVAFRALSWIWIYQLTGREMSASFRQRFLTALYRHAWHLAENLSVYFSPNTHLLGEAVALHALGSAFQRDAWRRRGAEIVTAQLDFQVQPDGSHFEQSTYYHVYALDFFLFFYLLAGHPESFRPKIARMAEYLHWLLGPARRLTFLGDDDGGRVFYPYGSRDRFGRATLSACGLLLEGEEWIGTREDIAEIAAWWIGPEVLSKASQRSIPSGARLFTDAGAAFLLSGDLFVQMDCGGFGYGGAGHSHSDTLSVIVWLAGEQVCIDPGTYTYIGNPTERHWFRGSAAHNTVQVDALDQGIPAGPFRWASKPEVQLTIFDPTPNGGRIEAVCRYQSFTHRRRLLLEPGGLLVLDEVEGPAGEHTCRQNWQLGPAASQVNFSFSSPAVQSPSQFSPAYGSKSPGTALIAEAAGTLPLRIAALIGLEPRGSFSIEEAQRLWEESAQPKTSP